MLIVGTHSWKNEVKRWQAPIDFETWRAEVCGRMAGDHLPLREYYEACWDAADCNEYLLVNGMLKTPPKRRVVTLDVETVNKRFAVCLWRECHKLLTRRLTPEARKLVCDMRVKMQVRAGIEILGKPDDGA